MVLTPRPRFQENKAYCSHHKELVVSDQFRAALEASLVEQVMALPNVTDPIEAAANFQRIMGARDFITHLLNVAEQSSPPNKPPVGNLNHSIR
jgi:hypothetical protein